MTEFKYENFLLKNRHILITGASSGIGRQCAISCSKQGAVITLVGRNLNQLEAVCDCLEGQKHHIIVQDVLELGKIGNVVDESVKVNGKLCGFIHSAGVEKTLPLKMHKPEVMRDVFSVNTFSGFEFIRVISQKKYIAAGSSSMVFISSIMGSVANGGLLAYCSSKGAVDAGVRSLAIELSKRNIRVNSVSPGHVEGTKMSEGKDLMLTPEAIEEIAKNHPLGLGTAEDIAHAVIFLLSDMSKWVTGTNLIVDGGYSAK